MANIRIERVAPLNVLGGPNLTPKIQITGMIHEEAFNKIFDLGMEGLVTINASGGDGGRGGNGGNGSTG